MDRDDVIASGKNDGLWDWNLATRRIHFSPRWISLLGCERREVGSTPEEWLQRIHPEDVDQVKREIDAVVAGDAGHFENQHRLRHKDGTYRWMSCRGMVMRDEKGHAVSMTGSHSDITADKVADAMTGLPNRLLLLDRLACAIEQTEQRSDFLFAVLILDLDRFRPLVERLGSNVADQVLIAVARRLETCLRTGNAVASRGFDYVLARLEGDAFGILLESLHEVGEARLVADFLLKEISAPLELGVHELFLSASIGVALSVTDYSRPEEALRDADIALHRAKSMGKARCEVFDTAILASSQTRIQLENDLREALERKELLVYYQPIVSLASNQIAGFEALMRWHHPVRGMVSPQEFIPIAERIGLIVPLGQWILQEACRQLKAWQADLGITKELWISVNVSVLQFKQHSLVRQIGEVLHDVNLDPHCLMLELTESEVMENPESASSLLMQLRVMGVRTSLDDFGTGYSSLSYLGHFPVDVLKIDNSLVQGMETNGDLAAVVCGTVDLARQLGLHVILEGIENSEQADLIRSFNCEYGQGYLFSQPLNCEKAGALLKERFPQGQGSKTATEEEDGGTHTRQSFRSIAKLLPEGWRVEQIKERLVRGRRTLLPVLAAVVLLLAGVGIAKLNRITSPQTDRSPQVSPQVPADTVPNVLSAAPEQPKSVPAQISTKDPAPQVPKQAKSAPARPPAESPIPVAKKAVNESFNVVHDHVMGSCKGILKISERTLSFISEKQKDGFTFNYGEFSYSSSHGWLIIQSGPRTYRFKSATARNKDEIQSELLKIVHTISDAATNHAEVAK